MLLHPYHVTSSPNLNPTGRNRVCIDVFIAVVLPLLVLDGLDKDTMSSVFAIMVISYCLIMLLLGVKPNVESFSCTLGFVFFLLAGLSAGIGSVFRDYNWFMHSFWHVFAGFAIACFVKCKKLEEREAKYVTVHREDRGAISQAYKSDDI